MCSSVNARSPTRGHLRKHQTGSSLNCLREEKKVIMEASSQHVVLSSQLIISPSIPLLHVPALGLSCEADHWGSALSTSVSICFSLYLDMKTVLGGWKTAQADCSSCCLQMLNSSLCVCSSSVCLVGPHVEPRCSWGSSSHFSIPFFTNVAARKPAGSTAFSICLKC